MDIGKKIKELRLERSLSMNEVSRLTGLAQSGLSEIENGNRSPSLDTLERIVTTAFNMSLYDFFSNTQLELTPDLNKLLHNAKDLTPEQLDAINNLIKSFK